MAAKKSPAPSKPASAGAGIIGELLGGELARVENDLRHGPNGTGWRGNESKREPLEARKALLVEALATL